MLPPYQPLFLGSAPDDGTGDGAHAAGEKINGNFARANALLRGVPKVDLRAVYSAPQDGQFHPLSELGLALAQARYPALGLNSSADLTKISQDSAALSQAEYDLRTGSGGIIGLADGGRPVLSQQVFLQQAFKVWLHGGKDNLINTAGCGTDAAIRLSGNRTGKNTQPLCDIELTTGQGGWASNSGGGTAGTGFAAGASAFQLDNVTGAEFKRVAWSGFDKPFRWGDEVYNLHFEDWSAGQNNVGINYDGTGADSGERVAFSNGCASNNNYGFLGDYKSQGGSAHLRYNSFDYNILRAIEYRGLAPDQYNAQVGLHVIGNHIETTGTCSGTRPRIFNRGSMFLTDNEFYEGGGGLPTYFVETDAFSSVSAFNNRMDADRVPLVGFNAPSYLARVDGGGNVGQNPNLPVSLFKGTDGTFLQPSLADSVVAQVHADPNPMRIEQAHDVVVLGYDAAGNYTMPTSAQQDIPVGRRIAFENIGPDVTFVGAVYAEGGTKLVKGKTAKAWKLDANTWFIYGDVS